MTATLSAAAMRPPAVRLWSGELDDRELIVDSFAGGGGASLGIEMAVGRPIEVEAAA